MTYRWLAISALLATLSAVGSFAGGIVEGEAIAIGIAFGMAVFVGVPFSIWVARLGIRLLSRLLESNLSRLASIAGEELRLAAENSSQRPGRLVGVASTGLALFLLLLPLTGVSAITGALLTGAGSPAIGPIALLVAATLAVGSSAGFAMVLAVTLYYRGRIEYLAFRLSVVRDTEIWRRRGRAVERTLRLRPA